MSSNEKLAGKRVVFNAKLSLLEPPEKPYTGEWPKKPPYWQIYGTSIVKGYWKILAGIAAFSIFTGTLTAYYQPRFSFGIIDRYFSPEVFYNEEERAELINRMKNASFEKEIEHSIYVRHSDLEIPTKELRKRIDSLEVAAQKEKPVIHVRSTPLS